MKHFYLFLSFTLLFIGCSKDDFDPLKPKDGQIVELFLDHYTTAGDQRISVNAKKDGSLYTYLNNFDEREKGYVYVVKAKVVVTPSGWADYPAYTFDYIKTLTKEKYQGTDTFALPLIGWVGDGDAFFLRKDAASYTYMDYQLTPADATVQADLDKAIEKGLQIMNTPGPRAALRVYVQHDPANYTKGYIVYRVQLQ